MPMHLQAHLQFTQSLTQSKNCKRACKPTHSNRPLGGHSITDPKHEPLTWGLAKYGLISMDKMK